MEFYNVASSAEQFPRYISMILSKCYMTGDGDLFAYNCRAPIEIEQDKINGVITLVSFDLAKLKDFIDCRGMKFNESKRKVMIIGCKHQISRLNFDIYVQ